MAASPSQPYRVDWRNHPTDFDALNQGLSGVFDHADQMFQELYGRVARLAASASTSGAIGARGPTGPPGFDGQDGEDGFLGYGRSPYGTLQVPANGGTGTSTIFTSGSIVFAGSAGVYAQDNSNFYWDDTLNRLQIGTALGSKYPGYITTASQVFIGGPWSPTTWDNNFDDVIGFNVQPTITAPNSATPSSGTAFLIGSYLSGSFVTRNNGGHAIYGVLVDSPPVTITAGSTVTFVAALYVENVYTPTVSVGNYAIYSAAGLNRFSGAMLLENVQTLTRGTITSAESTLVKTVTWNNAAAAFIYDDLTVTNTNSAAGSFLARWKVGGNTMFSVGKAGELTTDGTIALGANAAGTNSISGSLNLGSGLISISGPGTDSIGLQVANGTTNLTNGTKTTGTNATLATSATWNAGGVTFTHEKHNVTDSASATHSMLARWQVGGADRFSIEKNGNVKITDRSGDTALTIDDNASSNATLIAFQYAGSQIATIESNSGAGFRFNAFSIPIEWLQTNAVKMALDTNGRLGIGQTSPTAVLHVKAGTASANTAPVKLTSGTVLTSPEAGTIEYDGTNFYLTP